MPGPEVSVARFRLLAQATMLAAVALTTAGIYLAVVHQAWWWAGLAVVVGVGLLLPVQWVQLRAEAASADTLVFVTKRECTLCEEAQALLPRILEGTPFRVETRDVEDDRWLRRAFKDRVPVLLWQGEVVAQLGWDPDAVRVRLDGILARRRGPPRTGQQNP